MKAPVLVTGAAGFIGSNLTDRLAAEGQPVFAVDNFDSYYAPAVKRANLVAGLSLPHVRLIEGDVAHEAWLEQLLRDIRPAAVVHLAARPGVRSSFLDPETYLSCNALGTLSVLKACRSAGVSRLIVASSSSVYGDAPGPADEHLTPLRPLSPYGASKVAAEALCSAFALAGDLSITVLRFFTVYGRRQRPDMAIHKFTAAIDAGEELPLFGGGDSERDYTNIADIVDGITAALATDSSGYQVFNLGGGQPVRLSQVVSLLEDALGRSAHIRYLPPQEGDPDRTAADISLARACLGYTPCVSIEEGIREFVAWYRAAGREGRLARAEVST